MGETNIQWCARHTVDPRGTCAHGATDEGRCLDVECKRCWVKGYSANVWIGCEKVSAACRSCWAEAVAKRMGLDVWGAGADRQLTGDAVFASIRSWNKKAERTGQRRGVFWEDMGDLFEDRPEFVERRLRAFEAMEAAPMLDHMLLTKRPENVRRMVPPAWLASWPANVLPGFTAENQEWFDRRRDLALLNRIGTDWFCSYEPALGPVDFRGLFGVSWLIVGAESGGGARRMMLSWVRSARDQAAAAGVPFFLKQKMEGGKKVSLPMLDGRQWAEMPVSP